MEYFCLIDLYNNKWYVDVSNTNTLNLCYLKKEFNRYSYEIVESINNIIIDRHLNLSEQNRFCGINEHEIDKMYRRKIKCKGKVKSNGKY